MESLPRGSADPVGPPRGAAPAPPRAADLQKGKEIYTTTCVVCHGESGRGGSHGGAPLTAKLTPDTIASVVSQGRNDMPAFGSTLSPESLQDLTAYVLRLVAR